MPEAPSSAARQKPLLIPSLDGIRALAFLTVFATHAGVPYLPGGFGVTVFFFLSGYLITTLLRHEAATTGALSFKSFYLRRAMRILPPFYLVLAFALGLDALGLLPGVPYYWSALRAQLLHYSNYWVIGHGWTGLLAGTGVYWSLAVEEHFYLLMPAVYALLLRLGASGRAQWGSFLALCALTLLWRCDLVFRQGIVGDRTYIGSDTRFDSMLFGCALAVWGNPALDFESGATKPTTRERAALAASIALLFVTFVVRAPEFRESVRYTLQGLGLYWVFFFVVRYPNFGVTRVLGWAPLRFLGTLSYSLYLAHQVMIYAVQANVAAHPMIQAVLALGLTFALALAMWHLVERPSARLRRRLAAAP